MASTRKRRILILVVSGLILIVLIWLFAFHRREPPITVQTEKVTRRSLTEIVVANGRIQPVVQVKISPEVSGEITELPVKEGQSVNKGDLILKIKPDVYIAARNQAEASYKSSIASQASAAATLRKAQADFRRSQGLLESKLIPLSDFDQAQASYDIALAQLTNAEHQVEMAHALLASAEEELAKTAIASPLTGTISKLNSQLGERVLGTVENVGTEIMTISDLGQMEARVDVGEIDVVLIHPGQKAHLEVDAFRDRKFNGVVTDIANSSKGSSSATSAATSGSQSQDATKFEVRIRIDETEAFRPGMSVSAEIETRSRTNVLTVPLASVTTRAPKPNTKNTSAATNQVNSSSQAATNSAAIDRKPKESSKMSEVVFAVEGDHVKTLPVKIGISDDNYWEITDGLAEGAEIVSGGYRAINRDLDDGKKIRKGSVVN